MTSNKRKIDAFIENEPDTFQIKKKNTSSFFSMETNDSSPKEDSALSPFTAKDYLAPPLSSESHASGTMEKLSPLKVPNGQKKKERSIHLDSYDEIKKSYMNDPALYMDHYKAVKYRNYKYKLGTAMLIRNEDDAYNDFICKLVRVIKPKKVDSKGVLAFLEVQWYYKKSDLPKKYASFFPHISVNEVFLSSHKDFIMVDCINGPCQVLNCSEYDKLETIPIGTYFTKANYDSLKKKFDPPIEKWEKNCICRTPMNPDRNYIQCEKCEIWYHLECVGLSKDETAAIEQYFCNSCTTLSFGEKVTVNIDSNKASQEEKLLLNIQGPDAVFEEMFSVIAQPEINQSINLETHTGDGQTSLQTGSNTTQDLTKTANQQPSDEGFPFDFHLDAKGNFTDFFFEKFEEKEDEFGQGFGNPEQTYMSRLNHEFLQ